MPPAGKNRGAPTSVELSGIVKHFGDTVACDGAEFAAAAGRLNALVGENGAGKTTLMRVLAGRLQPDGGAIFLDGVPVVFRSPRAASGRAIAMVEQESRVIGGLSCLENIILGAEESKVGILSRRPARRAVEAILSRLNVTLDLDRPAQDLAATERQRAAIVRALYRGARILILDEPTSLLGPGEREGLFRVMRNLAASGAVVIFISHKLSEVFQVADTITVLRSGRTVLSKQRADTSPAEVASAMVGGEVTESKRQRRQAGGTVVTLEGVRTVGARRAALKGVTLDLRRGEITGVAGVAGNGQRALADVVAGLESPAQGRLVRDPSGLKTSIIGEDVDSMDLVSEMTVWENAILGSEVEYSTALGLDWTRGRRRAKHLRREFQFVGEETLRACALSGGNRQRLAIARELSGKPDLIVAEEPARGLDIRGTQLSRERLRAAATDGAAVLLISYDLDELYAVADRILVISSGRIFEPSTQPPERGELGLLMAG